jgi:hypothetical protein
MDEFTSAVILSTTWHSFSFLSLHSQVAAATGSSPNYNTPALAVVITGLNASERYVVRVAASNVGGQGLFGPSSNTNVTSTATVPSIPGPLTISSMLRDCVLTCSFACAMMFIC